MSKRIVVGLDGSPFAETAVNVAIARAKAAGGTVVGVAVIDQHGIEGSESGAGVGSAYYSAEMIEEKITEFSERTRQYLDQFAERCREAEVRFELARETGAPFQVLVEEGRCSDLLIVGLKTYFDYSDNARPGDTIRRLLHRPVTPVLAVPETWRDPKRIVIAYDDEDNTARAVTAFVHQHYLAPIAKHATLLYVGHEKDEKAEVMLRRPKAYLKSYGLIVKTVIQEGQPSDVILKTALNLQPAMVVMGAFQRSKLTEFFVKSTADKIVEDGTIPLFCFH